jgi:hypothetical protein
MLLEMHTEFSWGSLLERAIWTTEKEKDLRAIGCEDKEWIRLAEHRVEPFDSATEKLIVILLISRT